MTPDQVDQINAMSTVIVAITAVLSIALSMFLLFDIRATRSAAQVVAYPRLWSPGGMILALRLANYGPAAARDVELVYTLRDREGKVVAERRHGQAVLPAGGHVTFLPDSAIEGKSGGLFLNDLADMDLELSATWSWRDDRRRLAVLEHAIHRGEMAALTQDLRRDFYGGWSLYEPTSQESMEAIAEELEEIRKLIEKDDRRIERRINERGARRWRREREQNTL